MTWPFQEIIWRFYAFCICHQAQWTSLVNQTHPLQYFCRRNINSECDMMTPCVFIHEIGVAKICNSYQNGCKSTFSAKECWNFFREKSKLISVKVTRHCHMPPTIRVNPNSCHKNKTPFMNQRWRWDFFFFSFAKCSIFEKCWQGLLETPHVFK